MTSPNDPQPAAPPLLHPTIAPELVPERRGAVAVLSHTRREGEWILPRLFRVFAFFGNVELDLVHALLAPGTSVIEVRCIWGSVEILAPTDLRVEFEVDPVIASAEISRKAPSTTSPDAPIVRITGSAFMGSVELKVVDPNAPSFLAKLKKRFKGDTG
jgi:hypothetical protein